MGGISSVASLLRETHGFPAFLRGKLPFPDPFPVRIQDDSAFASGLSICSKNFKAERAGFEPADPIKDQHVSSVSLSTTQAPLHSLLLHWDGLLDFASLSAVELISTSGLQIYESLQIYKSISDCIFVDL